MGMSFLVCTLFLKIGTTQAHDIASFAPTEQSPAQLCPEVPENALTWKTTALSPGMVENSYGRPSRLLWQVLAIVLSLSLLSLLRASWDLTFHPPPPLPDGTLKPQLFCYGIIDNWGGYPQLFRRIIEISGDFDSFSRKFMKFWEKSIKIGAKNVEIDRKL